MIIKEPEAIKGYLRKLCKRDSRHVKRSIKKGDLMYNGNTVVYQIDDDPIISETVSTKEGPKGGVPWKRIHDSTEIEDGGVYKQKISRLYEKTTHKKGNERVLPFSDALKERIGLCYERAVLVQLAAQKARNSFFIDGAANFDGTIGGHVFNIIFKEGKPFLVDAMNPEGAEHGRKDAIYATPIEGIDTNDYGRLVLKKDKKDKREYYLEF